MTAIHIVGAVLVAVSVRPVWRDMRAQSIDQCPMIIEHRTGRRWYLAMGGKFRRCPGGWLFDKDGRRTFVTVPETVAALEARDRRAVAA